MSSLFVAPSTPIVLPLGVCPLAIMVSLPRLDEGWNWMPGSRATAANALRFRWGSSTSSWLVTVPPTSADVRSTRGASPETVMVSSRAPISRTMSMSRVLPTPMAKSVRWKPRKPGSSAVMVNTPGTSCAAKKLPSPLVVTSRNVPVSWLVTTTLTPGNAPPVSSVTEPRNSDRPCWPTAEVPIVLTAATAQRHSSLFAIASPPREGNRRVKRAGIPSNVPSGRKSARACHGEFNSRKCLSDLWLPPPPRRRPDRLRATCPAICRGRRRLPDQLRAAAAAAAVTPPGRSSPLIRAAAPAVAGTPRRSNRCRTPRRPPARRSGVRRGSRSCAAAAGAYRPPGRRSPGTGDR